MPYQVITRDDIDPVERKILSKKYFNADESDEQLTALFERFIGANTSLKKILETIFILEKGLDLLTGPERKSIREDLVNALIENQKLSERLKDKSQATQVYNDWQASEKNLEELYKRDDELNAKLEEIRSKGAGKLGEIQAEIKNEKQRFESETAKLKSTLNWQNPALVIVSLLVTILIALGLEYSGLSSFPNILLTILQVSIVFFLTEYGVNNILKWNTRITLQPVLKTSLDFLKNEYAEYDLEVDRICNEAGIKRRDIFYKLDALYDKLSIVKGDGSAPRI